jgi:hypothetical protein
MGEMKRPPLRISLSSIREGLRVLCRNPMALYYYIFEGTTGSVEQQSYGLVRKLGQDSQFILDYWADIQYKIDFNKHIFDKLKGMNYGQMYTPSLLYVLVRQFRPSIVVETGVAAGVSSAYILQAMKDNNFGHLYSIDLPNNLPEAHYLPKGEESGFAVPSNLRSRWTLWIGKSKDLLEPLLAKVGKVDVFIHDSDHSYTNMFFEYNKVWDSIQNGGLLISHDINENAAFKDFSELCKLKYHEIYFSGIGIMKK